MLFRTDLALERMQIIGKDTIEGVRQRSFEMFSTSVCEIDVCNEAGAAALGKPMGRYITVEVPPFTVSRELTDGRLDAVVSLLRQLLPPEGDVLVAGLGNTQITPDALGPACARHVFATRHIEENLQKSIGIDSLRCVSVLIPGVLGCTGIEASEIITAVAQKIKPSAIICIDALAAQSVDRLATTVQMCNSGISPGSGVGNHRKEISSKTIGVPVISLGVPTVVSAGNLARDAAGQADNNSRSELDNMFVSPREIDTVIDSAAKLLALSVNCALQNNLSVEELLSLM